MYLHLLEPVLCRIVASFVIIYLLYPLDIFNCCFPRNGKLVAVSLIKSDARLRNKLWIHQETADVIARALRKNYKSKHCL